MLKKLIKEIKLRYNHKKWVEDNGDQTLRLNYQLDKDSVVFDLGGYKGEWSQEIINRYNCYIYVFEPVPKFYNEIRIRFSNNQKVKCFNVGLSNRNYNEQIYIDNDASSTFVKNKDISNNKQAVQIEMHEIEEFIIKEGIERIDLMKINIEGGEYDVLEHLTLTGQINNINNIQVQFHNFVKDAEIRRKKVQDMLNKTHRMTYNYDFIWENWEKII